MGMRKEDKILYNDGDQVRALRGRIVDEGGFFIEVHRKDGIVKISRNAVIKIEVSK